MRYEVIAYVGDTGAIVAVKKTMDDAIDVLSSMEQFDKQEGMHVVDHYRVRIVKDDQ